MTSRDELFSSIEPSNGKVTVADGSNIPVLGRGTIQLVREGGWGDFIWW